MPSYISTFFRSLINTSLTDPSQNRYSDLARSANRLLVKIEAEINKDCKHTICLSRIKNTTGSSRSYAVKIATQDWLHTLSNIPLNTKAIRLVNELIVLVRSAGNKKTAKGSHSQSNQKTINRALDQLRTNINSKRASDQESDSYTLNYNQNMRTLPCYIGNRRPSIERPLISYNDCLGTNTLQKTEKEEEIRAAKVIQSAARSYLSKKSQ